MRIAGVCYLSGEPPRYIEVVDGLVPVTLNGEMRDVVGLSRVMRYRNGDIGALIEIFDHVSKRIISVNRFLSVAASGAREDDYEIRMVVLNSNDAFQDQTRWYEIA